jgi:formimidoylglutamate deiminase
VIALHFAHALLPDGWAEDVRIELEGGRIAALAAGAPPRDAERHAAIALPGLANLHSHAFQRAMAGRAETGGSGPDSFWTWREVMYRFLARLTPEHLEAFAAQAYAEMLEAGFTAVGEFHYLHHAPDGRPYDDLGEMTGRIVAASAATGIALTLLPVLYRQGGFGGQPASDAQRRFVNDPARFLALLARARAQAAALPGTQVGVAPHSLRAVGPDDLAALLDAVPAGPVHIHVAEQRREVEDCLAWSGQRPVEWLLAHHPVGPRWCLVHATHMTADETAALARTRAVAGLCPITEANLGDGLFGLPGFAAAGGSFGVGSDSNIRIDPAEELRLLEYGQRLAHQARTMIAPPRASSGRTLFDAARSGGAQALGRAAAGLAQGAPADIVALDPSHPALLAQDGDGWLDGWIFAGDRLLVRDVWAAGRHVVAEGRHVDRDALRRRYAAALRALLDAT